MAVDLTLETSALHTTTTVAASAPGGAQTQAYETDTLAVAAAIDVADNRALSLELSATSDALGPCGLEVFIESRETTDDAWREIARFDRFDAAPGRSGKQRRSCVSDKLVRARWRIACFGNRGGVTFGVTGRAVGSAE